MSDFEWPTYTLVANRKKFLIQSGSLAASSCCFLAEERNDAVIFPSLPDRVCWVVWEGARAFVGGSRSLMNSTMEAE